MSWNHKAIHKTLFKPHISLWAALAVVEEEVSQRRDTLSKFTQEGGCRARNRTQQSRVSGPLLTTVINKSWCCDSVSTPGLLSGVRCTRQCKTTVTFLPQNASKLKGERNKWRTLVQEGCTGLFLQTGQVHRGLYINHRKGNDSPLVIFTDSRLTSLSRLMKPSRNPSHCTSGTASGRTPGVKEMETKMLPPPGTTCSGDTTVWWGRSWWDCTSILSAQLLTQSCTSSMKSPGDGPHSGLH